MPLLSDGRPKQVVPHIRQRNSIPFQRKLWKNTCCQKKGRTSLSFCGRTDCFALAALLKIRRWTEKETYECLTEYGNIYRAYRQSAKGKHRKNEVIQYETNLHMQLWYLQERLKNRTYTPSGYHKFTIYDPKEREMQALSFAESVFQHLLCDTVLRPYFEPRLIYDNAACRQGKGTHFALKRLKQFFHKHYKKHGAKGYILKFDIRKYFLSINHEVLKEKLSHFLYGRWCLNSRK